MKPVTNLLLIIAIISYVFLPFRTMELVGSVTGFSYTAGLITENFSFAKTLFALLPFIAVFGAITFNSLKNRWWGIAAGLFIMGGIVFYVLPELFENMPLNHAPDVVPDNMGQEVFKVVNLNSGYYTSCALMWAALVSCFLSLLPFKFNTILERSIDEKVESGINKGKQSINKMQKGIEDEYRHIESKIHKTHSEKSTTPPASSDIDKEDPTRFMPPTES